MSVEPCSGVCSARSWELAYYADDVVGAVRRAVRAAQALAAVGDVPARLECARSRGKKQVVDSQGGRDAAGAVVSVDD